jgi:hypothetical protein
MIEMAMAEIAAGREGPPMPTSPPFLRPLKSAERNPQKGAADDVGAEDQHPINSPVSTLAALPAALVAQPAPIREIG